MADRRPRRWPRTRDPRPVGIVHAAADRALALHLLGDLRSLGVAAMRVELDGRSATATGTWDHMRAVVVLYGLTVPSYVVGYIAAFQDAGGRAVVIRGEPLKAEPAPGAPRRGSTVRMFPKELELMPRVRTYVMDGRDYKPRSGQHRSNPGYRFLAEVLGVGPDQRGEARQGYVFVSYRGLDRRWVFDEIVPALAEQGLGLFDYRATDELDEKDDDTLTAEMDRWLERCAVLLVVATPDWPSSPANRHELATARRLGRPVVTVRRPSAKALAAVGRPDAAVRFSTAERHGPALADAVRRAVARSDRSTASATPR